MIKYEEIIEYLEKIGVSGIREREEYFTLPTVCHNSEQNNSSKKLYLYKNEDETPLFHCYTKCQETFNIYQFIQKYHRVRGKELDYKEAFKEFHGFSPQFKNASFARKEEPEIRIDKFKNPLEIVLPEYPSGALDIFKDSPHQHPWYLEGIDELALEKFKIQYSASYQGVIIPHFDWRGRLVGIRIRTYDPRKVENYKYMPMLINNIYYRHPLSLSFFGLFENQKNIKKSKRVILAESEKAVLQAESMFPEPNIVLGVCGSSISEWQTKMLVYYCGVQEVIIAFDKEYSNFSESFEYVERIKRQVSFLTNFAKVGILIDDKNTFDLKESPFDRRVSDFKQLTVKYIS